MLTLLLAMQLTTLSDGSFPSARLVPNGTLVAQASTEPGYAQRRITAINTELSLLRTEWPAGLIVGAVLGFVFSPALLVGPFLLLLGIGFSSGPAILIGAVLSLVGLAGLLTGILSAVAGANAAVLADNRRRTLLDERNSLQQRLRQDQPYTPAAPPPGYLPPGVERELTMPTWVAIASF